MNYHIDSEKVSLDALRHRLQQTDLVPSRASLLDGIEEKFAALQTQGVGTLAALRNELKTPKRMEALANATGIDVQYLVLLRREIESHFPKPAALGEFDWLPQGEIARLTACGLRDAAALLQAAGSAEGRAALVAQSGADPAVVDELARLANLSRVQWVSPTFARMLREAGFESAAAIAAANAQELCDTLERINAGDRYFKGKIGLRDVKRLIMAAGYAPD